MSPPILFFFRGYDPYIAFALSQARRTNPDAPIYLLGDDAPDLHHLGVEQVRFRDYPGRRDAFVERYVHLSLHELECERLCLERWFYLGAFLENRGIERFSCLDSDYLLFANLEQTLQGLPPCEAAGVPFFFGFCHCFHRDLIERFCTFILDAYADSARMRSWQAWFEEIRQRGPSEHGAVGVSDMTLSELFIREAPVRCLNLLEPREGVVFDVDGLGMQDGRPPTAGRQIGRDSAGRVYALMPDGSRLQLAGLHMWGKNKFSSAAFTGWPAPILRAFWRPNYRRNLVRLFRHARQARRFRRGILRALD